MKADALEREAERLAAEVARCGRGELGKRWRCPARLKSRIYRASTGDTVDLFLRGAAGTDQLNHLEPELGRIRWT